MKVVLFCGGLGMRLRDYNHEIPKPLVPIGSRPILWHVMKYYATYGHRDFILCLGYKGEAIKEYFINYKETASNDFVLSEGGRRVDLLRRDIEDWRITFVETGLNANIGERLLAVETFLGDDRTFLANYSDGLTDCPLSEIIANHEGCGNDATFLAVRPNYSFHVVSSGADGEVTGINEVTATDMRINGGYFVLNREIFDYIVPGEELVLEPFQRLIAKRRLGGHRWDGFWRGVDTFKDLQDMENRLAQGTAPWQVWKQSDTRYEPGGRQAAARGRPAPSRRSARPIATAV